MDRLRLLLNGKRPKLELAAAFSNNIETERGQHLCSVVTYNRDYCWAALPRGTETYLFHRLVGKDRERERESEGERERERERERENLYYRSNFGKYQTNNYERMTFTRTISTNIFLRRNTYTRIMMLPLKRRSLYCRLLVFTTLLVLPCPLLFGGTRGRILSFFIIPINCTAWIMTQQWGAANAEVSADTPEMSTALSLRVSWLVLFFHASPLAGFLPLQSLSLQLI